jgi:hypothetical protein
MLTSPAAVKLTGTAEVTAVSETLKTEELLSVMFNKFPTLPLEPILILKRSPVAVVEEPGDQSRAISFPEVRAVDVELISKIFPDDQVFPDVDSCINFPVVMLLEVMYVPVPEVIELALYTKPDVVVVPETTLEENVCDPVAVVKLRPPAPAAVTVKFWPDVGAKVMAPVSRYEAMAVPESLIKKSPVDVRSTEKSLAVPLVMVVAPVSAPPREIVPEELVNPLVNV